MFLEVIPLMALQFMPFAFFVNSMLVRYRIDCLFINVSNRSHVTLCCYIQIIFYLLSERHKQLPYTVWLIIGLISFVNICLYNNIHFMVYVYVNKKYCIIFLCSWLLLDKYNNSQYYNIIDIFLQYAPKI